MAANIEFNSNRNTYSFYSLKDVPWHGLGTVVEEAKLQTKSFVLLIWIMK